MNLLDVLAALGKLIVFFVVLRLALRLLSLGFAALRFGKKEAETGLATSFGKSAYQGTSTHRNQQYPMDTF